MKNIYILFISIFISISSLSSQEQISHFVSDRNNTKNKVINIDNKNYLISIYRNDKVKVFEIVSLDSITFLHEKYFQGLYENNSIKFHMNYIIFESIKGFITFNILDGTFIEREIYFPISFIRFSFFTDNNFIAEIGFSDSFVNTKRYIYDYNTNLIDSIPIELDYFSYRNGNNFVVATPNFGGNKSIYIYYNCVNNISDTLFSSVGRKAFFLDENKMWYIDNEDNLTEFDYDSRQKIVYQNVETNGNEIDLIVKNNNKVYLFNSEMINSEIQVRVYNIQTKQEIYSIKLGDIELNNIYDLKVYNDKILILGRNDLKQFIVVFNTLTKNYKLFESINFTNLNISKNGEIVVIYRGKNDESSFEIIDIDSLTSKIFFGNYNLSFISDLNLIKVDDKYICSTYYFFRYQVSLFELDPDSLIFYPKLDFDETDVGFEDQSKIIELNDKILVLANNLYQLDNDSLIRINTIDFNKDVFNKYKIQNNKVYFRIYNDNDPNKYFTLYSYDTKEVKKEMVLKKSIDTSSVQNYLVVDNYIYYESLNRNLYRYNKNDNTIELIDKVKKYLKKNQLIKVDSFIYYVNEGVKVISNNGKPKQIISDKKTLYSGFTRLKNRLFFNSSTSFYEIKNDKIDTIYKKETGKKRILISVDKSRNNLICADFDKGIFYYDGVDFNPIIDSSMNYSVMPILDKSFLITGNNYFSEVAFIYNSDTEELLTIPNSQVEGSALGVFSYRNDTILLTRAYLNPRDKICVYSCSNNFTRFELKYKIVDVGNYIYNYTFISCDNGGILSIGDVISLVETDLNIQPFIGIKGNSKYPKIIKKDKNFYFLAIDYISGRQLFKYSFVPIKTADINKSYLKIFPNPVKDILFFKNNIADAHYEIYNIEGKLMMINKLLPSGINVAGLQTGIYIVRLKNKNRTISGKFMKY